MFIFSCGTLEDKNHFEAAGILILLIPILLFLLLIQLIVKDFRSQKWRNVFILIKAPANQYLTKSDPKLFNWAAKFLKIDRSYLWVSVGLFRYYRRPDVGGQRCPDSVRIYCAVSVSQNQVQIRNPDTRKPSRLKISDFD